MRDAREGSKSGEGGEKKRGEEKGGEGSSPVPSPTQRDKWRRLMPPPPSGTGPSLTTPLVPAPSSTHLPSTSPLGITPAWD